MHGRSSPSIVPKYLYGVWTDRFRTMGQNIDLYFALSLYANRYQLNLLTSIGYYRLVRLEASYLMPHIWKLQKYKYACTCTCKIRPINTMHAPYFTVFFILWKPFRLKAYVVQFVMCIKLLSRFYKLRSIQAFEKNKKSGNLVYYLDKSVKKASSKLGSNWSCWKGQKGE